MIPPADVVIVGAGHAGVQLAATLREEGFDGPIVMLSGESHLPYQRPPLSKSFLKGESGPDGLLLRGEGFYAANGIDLRLGQEVTAIDRGARRLHLASGAELPYGHLVLATGTRPRPIDVPGVALPGVLGLRNLTEARHLKERLNAARQVVVIGAGFIGLELAALATTYTTDVRIVELGTRVLGRAVSPIISQFYLDAHRAFGAEFLFGASVASFEGGDQVEAVRLSDGSFVPADLVLVGVGVLPQDSLARAAGLECGNGIVVNARLQTSDPDISAIGDCTEYPSLHLGKSIRLESVQNAVDHARCLARRLTGRPIDYEALPWFWSDQRDLKLQIAGLSIGCDIWVQRGDPATRAFSVFGFRGDRLAAVESVNRPADHMSARRILGGGLVLTPAQAADPGFDLKEFAKSAPR